MSPRPFSVPTAELFRHRGVRQHVERAGPLPEVALSAARLTDDDVVLDATLEAQGSTVIATGKATARWVGECRRCLETTGGEVTVDLHEVFDPSPVEGETYKLHADHVDLAPAVRDAVALALPLAPLCDEACGGPDPEGHPVGADDEADPPGADGAGDDDDGAPADPRWSALDALRFDP